METNPRSNRRTRRVVALASPRVEHNTHKAEHVALRPRHGVGRCHRGLLPWPTKLIDFDVGHGGILELDARVRDRIAHNKRETKAKNKREKATTSSRGGRQQLWPTRRRRGGRWRYTTRSSATHGPRPMAPWTRKEDNARRPRPKSRPVAAKNKAARRCREEGQEKGAAAP